MNDQAYSDIDEFENSGGVHKSFGQWNHVEQSHLKEEKEPKKDAKGKISLSSSWTAIYVSELAERSDLHLTVIFEMC